VEESGVKRMPTLIELCYKQKGRCYWCKRSMALDGEGDLAATREHLVPQSRGGKAWVKQGRKRVKNIVAACRKCNGARGNMDAHTFRTQMRPEQSL